jgi:hypothetical protein
MKRFLGLGLAVLSVVACDESSSKDPATATRDALNPPSGLVTVTWDKKIELRWQSMNAEPPEPGQPEPPALPAILLEPWPVIIVIAVGWLIAAILAYTVAGLHEWRPVAVAGLGVGVLGTSIFLWQRHAVRRGSRGAQSGLS